MDGAVSGGLVAKLKQAMPKSSPLKVKVLSALVKSISPLKKENIFSDVREELPSTPGQPKLFIVSPH